VAHATVIIVVTTAPHPATVESEHDNNEASLLTIATTTRVAMLLE
jgi:hypothetical protein